MAAKRPTVTVSDRIKNRLKNPFGQTSSPIELTDPELVCRWCNSAIISDKFWRDKEKGWDPVTPDMLKDKNQIGAFVTSADGYVTRGEKQQEILLCMKRTDRDAIQMAKTEQNIRDMRLGRQKEAVASAAAENFGDQAGEFMSKVKMVGTITDQHERIHRDAVVDE
jgi:hypothetical protein